MQRVLLDLQQILREGPGPSRILVSTEVSPNELARYAIGLANAQGGLILVGIVNGQVQDASDIHPLMLTHAIFELSAGRLSVNVHPEEIDGKRVLVVHVPQGPYLLATPEGEVVAWDGTALVPINAYGHRDPAPDQDYTATVPPMSSLSDIDPLEVGRLRRNMRGRNNELAQLADLDFMLELGLLVDAGGELKPTVAGILMAGTPQALRRHVPQAEVCYYHHATPDVEFQFREDLLRPLSSALERLRELIQVRNGFSPLQVGLFRIEIWDFDEVVYREAILNALIHRDYQSRDAVHIHHFPDRLEVMNPGGLPGGITSQNILRHQPKRRNPLLAEALARLGYVERAGVGVDKMYQLLLRHGKEPPEFHTYPDSVTLTIHNPGFDAEFVRFIARKQEEMQAFSLDMLIVLACLKREGECGRPELAGNLQLPEDRVKRILVAMEERDLIERTGRGSASVYTLSESSRTAMGLRRRFASGRAANAGALQDAMQRAARSPLVRPYLSDPDYRAEVLKLASRPEGVSNAEVREALGLDTQQSSRMLRSLVKQGLLLRFGSAPRNVRYALKES
ncbi:ATP-dependent DNA helicase RecG [Deinobacterium chartae]|uniref:ATP-dependent DNA helicase RecG n=1 Tax=Deinobacterium chartae TaxID=521158 RepID=A0A841HY89_9DEIO|nr:helix-turn-helix domain-containing protein [Deinobacterium chartae]MBB6096898.1 ATP-dependent DNA helicase RecG [Deinobacterium chartae]